MECLCYLADWVDRKTSTADVPNHDWYEYLLYQMAWPLVSFMVRLFFRVIFIWKYIKIINFYF
jgi:hypothetical protein